VLLLALLQSVCGFSPFASAPVFPRKVHPRLSQGNWQSDSNRGWDSQQPAAGNGYGQSSGGYQSSPQNNQWPNSAPQEERLFYETPDLGKMRTVRVRTFAGKVLVDIREFFYGRGGDVLPTKKGIALSPEQWKVLKDHMADIDKAIEAAAGSVPEPWHTQGDSSQDVGRNTGQGWQGMMDSPPKTSDPGWRDNKGMPSGDDIPF